MAQFLGVFKIKTLFTRHMKAITASEVLRGIIRGYPKSLWIFSSLFLFGYHEYVKVGTEFREMHVAPVRSFATNLF